MSQQLKKDMDELSEILTRELDKTLKETRTKSGKNMFDLYQDKDKFSAIVARKLVDSGLMEEKWENDYMSGVGTFFLLEYNDCLDKFEVSSSYDESILQDMKTATEAIELKE